MGDVHPPARAQHRQHPSKQTTRPTFIITGFGHFCGVPVNPTEQLIKWLRQHPRDRTAAGDAVGGAAQQLQQIKLDHESLEQPYCISSLDVLDVSGSAVDAFMQQQQQLLLQHAAETDVMAARQPVVLVHFGVDTKRPSISLELQAYNNATFNCPDQAGWQPKAALIEAAPGLGISSVRTTTLPLQELVQQLRDAGFECGVSLDAGRFVCNYTYYKSLELTSRLQQQLAWRQQQKSKQKQQQQGVPGADDSTRNGDAPHPTSSSNGEAVSNGTAAASSGSGSDGGEAFWPCFSLFVHMPHVDVVNQARQCEFALHLLDLLAQWVSGATHSAAQTTAAT